MPRILPQDYQVWLTHGNAYKFVPCDDDERVVTVTARRSRAGTLWLLYEHVGDTLELRYWVMPNGGVSEAREIGPDGDVQLRVLPWVADVRDLQDPALLTDSRRKDGLDAGLRKEINDLLEGIDWGDGL
jgi:hypothetical protein